jgi:hypothetical protein
MPTYGATACWNCTTAVTTGAEVCPSNSTGNSTICNPGYYGPVLFQNISQWYDIIPLEPCCPFDVKYLFQTFVFVL